MKSARKAKDKLHKVCERASETREQTLHGQEQNRMHIASMRESRDSVQFSNQHTSTITCTAAPRVWHFYLCEDTWLWFHTLFQLYQVTANTFYICSLTCSGTC